jgi:hypothetical protein
MSEMSQMGDEIRNTVKRLLAQNEALVKRCAAKDDEFAQERKSWKVREARMTQEIKTLKRDLRTARGTNAKKGDEHVFG